MVCYNYIFSFLRFLHWFCRCERRTGFCFASWSFLHQSWARSCPQNCNFKLYVTQFLAMVPWGFDTTFPERRKRCSTKARGTRRSKIEKCFFYELPICHFLFIEKDQRMWKCLFSILVKEEDLCSEDPYVTSWHSWLVSPPSTTRSSAVLDVDCFPKPKPTFRHADAPDLIMALYKLVTNLQAPHWLLWKRFFFCTIWYLKFCRDIAFYLQYAVG